jgi:hypothetical protein
MLDSTLANVERRNEQGIAQIGPVARERMEPAKWNIDRLRLWWFSMAWGDHAQSALLGVPAGRCSPKLGQGPSLQSVDYHVEQLSAKFSTVLAHTFLTPHSAESVEKLRRDSVLAELPAHFVGRGAHGTKNRCVVALHSALHFNRGLRVAFLHQCFR